jgi:hypothetical protein
LERSVCRLSVWYWLAAKTLNSSFDTTPFAVNSCRPEIYGAEVLSQGMEEAKAIAVPGCKQILEDGSEK